MIWKTIRLELGPTASFPKGSASRAFVLCVPLDEDGRIDQPSMARNPGRATVKRFWASDPDQFGRLEYAQGSWILNVRDIQTDQAYRLVTKPLEIDALVDVKGPDGTTLPFRVASIGGSRPLSVAAE